MTLKEKILFGAAVVVVAIVCVFGIAKFTTGSSTNVGAVGGMLAEHYLPFVMANGGYNSALPIQTTSSVTAGNLVVTNAIVQSGITTTMVRQTLVSGTSTPCAIATPLATSTVENFSMNITTATSSAITWEVGTSTTAYATTTSMLSAVAVGAAAQYTIAYAGQNGNVASSGNYIVVGPTAATAASTGAYTSIILGGTCEATFISAN